MKFYRMDGDHPDWPVWDLLYEEVGRRDFHKAKVLYHDLYGYMAQSYTGDDTQKLRIVLSKVAKSTRISRSKVAQMLPKVGRVFAFEHTIVQTNAAGEPLVVDIFYPNFLKKQRLPKRDGNGKFCQSDEKDHDRQEGRQEEEKEKDVRQESFSKRGNNDARARVYDPPPISNSPPPPEKKVDENLIEKIWATFEGAYQRRYGRIPKRTSENTKELVSFASAMGSEALNLVRFYLNCEKDNYVRYKHPFKFLAEDCSTLLWLAKHAPTAPTVDEHVKATIDGIFRDLDQAARSGVEPSESETRQKYGELGVKIVRTGDGYSGLYKQCHRERFGEFVFDETLYSTLQARIRKLAHKYVEAQIRRPEVARNNISGQI